MPPVRYEGGSADGVELDDAPERFTDHPQRELHGNDPEHPFEMYRRRGVEGGVVVFEFDGARAERVLDEDQNYPTDAADPARTGDGTPAP